MVNNSLGNPLVRTAVRAVMTGSALAATLGVAHAQQAVPAPATPAASNSAASAQLQEVVVTGSRIATPNQTSISPITFVTAKQFQQLGATRVEDVLNRLPQVFADQNSTSINGGNGTENVDLRGLGANRTLVLIDGLRMPYGDPRSGAADLKMIPTALISNVQILTGGASSIYGADAVAGVVNFKLNDHFQGVELIANGSGYFHSNGNDQNVVTDLNNFNQKTGFDFKQAPGSVATGAQKMLTFIAGFNTPDNKGNFTFYASYRNIAKATQNLFSYSACSLKSGFLAPRGNGNFTCGGSLTSYPGTFLKYAGSTTVDANTVGPGGTLLPLSAEPEFNYGPLNYMQAPDITWTAGAFFHYTLNEHAQVYANTMFMDDRTQLQIAPSGDFATSANVDCANPYLSAQELATWCGGSTAGYVDSGGAGNGLYILRRNVEGGNRFDDEQHTDWRLVLGTKGSISQNWTYDVSYQFSQVNLSQVYNNDISTTKLNYALDAVMGPNGPECRVTSEGNTSGLAAGCVPWNIFAPGQVSPAAVKYLVTPGMQRGQVQMQVVDSNFTGDLSQYVQLPTAHSGLQVALGTEYRDVASFTQPDVEFQTGDLSGQGGATLPVAGAIESWDEYIEARLPLIQDKPFAHDLYTDDSFRHSHYALSFGATNTFSLGLVWGVTRDVRLRGTFTRAVRAPNVVELFSTQSVALDGSQDPCAGTPIYTAAQCANTGATHAISPNPAQQYNGLLGGNTTLQPETATTKSFGIGFTPSFLRNFSAQVDYFDIDIKGVIASIGENNILAFCATQDLFCNLIHRAPGTESLWLTPTGFVTDTLQNVGELQEKGVDVDLNYSLDLGRWGGLSANFTGTYLTSYQKTPIAALPGSAYDCAGYYGPTCSSLGSGAGGPLFKWRHDMTVTWDTPLRALSVTAGWRFMSGVTLESLSSNPNLGTVSAGASIANGKISNTDASIPAFNYLDLSGAYRITDKIMFRLGVNNLLDRAPPIIGGSNLPSPPIGNGNTMPGTYDWGGRYVFGELTAQF
jgi:iron complex outermembrane receptor protein